MRAIHLAHLDKARPAVILTREYALSYLRRVTVAPITSTSRNPDIEVPVGHENGIDQDSVINCDNIVTVPREDIGRYLGQLTVEQEWALTAAIHAAFRLR